MPKKDFKEKSKVVNRYNPFKNIEKSKDKNIDKGLADNVRAVYNAFEVKIGK